MTATQGESINTLSIPKRGMANPLTRHISNSGACLLFSKHLKRLACLGGLALASLFGILYNATQPQDKAAFPPKVSETQHQTENLRVCAHKQAKS